MSSAVRRAWPWIGIALLGCDSGRGLDALSLPDAAAGDAAVVDGATGGARCEQLGPPLVGWSDGRSATVTGTVSVAATASGLLIRRGPLEVRVAFDRGSVADGIYDAELMLEAQPWTGGATVVLRMPNSSTLRLVAWSKLTNLAIIPVLTELRYETGPRTCEHDCATVADRDLVVPTAAGEIRLAAGESGTFGKMHVTNGLSWHVLEPIRCSDFYGLETGAVVLDP